MSKRFAFLTIRPFLRFYWLISRSFTLGVRAIVTDDKGRVLLVKHSYVEGWFLPGGGVERHQTAEQALRIELREEAMIELDSPPVLIGIYNNSAAHPRDQVLLYRVDHWHQTGEPLPNREIIATGFFARDELPTDTTKATRARIDEVFLRQPPSSAW